MPATEERSFKACRTTVYHPQDGTAPICKATEIPTKQKKEQVMMNRNKFLSLAKMICRGAIKC